MVYSEGYVGSYGNGNSRGSSPIPVVRLGARLNEPSENNDHAGSEEEKAKVEETARPAVVEESEPYVVEEKREVVEEPAKDEEDFVPIDDEIADVGIVDEPEGKATQVDEAPLRVEDIQEETASAVSEPDAEAGPVNTAENDTQPSSLRQEQEEGAEASPRAETTSDKETLPTTLEATVESAEPEETTGEVNKSAEEPELAVVEPTSSELDLSVTHDSD